MSTTKINGKYRIDVTLRSGGGRLRITAFTEKRSSERLEERIRELDNCVCAGISPTRELSEWLETASETILQILISHNLLSQSMLERSKGLTRHLEEFIKFQTGQALKGKLQTKQIKLLNARLSRLIAECSFEFLSDISGNKLDSWLTDKYSTNTLSAKSCNHYLQAMKQFCRWLCDNNRMHDNPIATLKPIRLNSTNTEQRRALTEEEIRKLLNTTEQSLKVHHRLTGLERAIIYRIALETGLRHNEIRTLKRSDFDLNNMTVTVRDINSKNGKSDTIPLKAGLTQKLQAYFSENPALPQADAITNMQARTGFAMVKKDMQEAGIEYLTDLGKADFHGLRHTFCSMLARSGVQPQIAQKLMRHSDVNLTMKHYTHILLDDKKTAIDSLPDIISEPQIIQIVSNGTDNISEIQENSDFSNDLDLTYSADNDMTCQDRDGQFNQKYPTTAGDLTNCYKSRNTVKDSVECTQSTLDTIDTNWWARRDLNPYESYLKGF